MDNISLEEMYQNNSNLKREDVKHLKEWLTKKPHLPAITDEMLIMFLHSCDYKLEATKHTIDCHYTLKSNAPELWSNREPSLPEIQQALDIVQMSALPGRDAAGNLVLVCRFADPDPSRFMHVETTKTYIMFHDLVLQQAGLVPGVVMVLDQKGASFSLATRISISVLRTHLAYLQEGFPGKIVNFHLINCVPVTEKLLAIAKPFLRSELLKKSHSWIVVSGTKSFPRNYSQYLWHLETHLKVHGSSMESFYKCVPREILPQEYGGNAGPFSDLHKKTVELLHQHRDWFMEEEKLRVDESKRPVPEKSSRNVYGIMGSFKKLDID